MDSEAIRDELGAIREGVEGISDLFRRRLLDDKDKRRAFDELYGQLERSTAQVDGTIVRPLVMDCIRVIDRLDRYTGEEREFVISLRAELLEALHRVGTIPIPMPPTPTEFEPAKHEVGSMQEVDDSRLTGQVVRYERRGYTDGERVLRPTRVVIGSSGSDDPDRATVTGSEEPAAPGLAEEAVPSQPQGSTG